MKVTLLCKTLGCLICLLVLAVPGQADTFMKEVTNTDAMEMMGQKQPATSDTSITWYAAGKACLIGADGKKTVYRADKAAMYLVDPQEETYSEVPLTWLSDAVDEAKTDAETAEAMKMMGGMMKFKVTVTPTEETQKIKDWEATKYIVEIDMGMGKGTTNTWAAPDLEIDASTFMALSNIMMTSFEGFEESVEEMKKVKGMTVLSNTEFMMMGSVMKSSTELLEFAEKEAPEGIYDIPEGYEKTDLPSPMGR
jgi:hypothetical protein